MGRWGRDGPPEEAYERLSGLGRFDPLAGVVDEVVAGLLATYDARPEPASLRGKPGVRLVPAAGAPLTLVVDLPYVLVRAGRWTGGGAFPPCACDACDEDAGTAAAMLREWVAEVTGGLAEAAPDGDPPERAAWPPWPRRAGDGDHRVTVTVAK